MAKIGKIREVFPKYAIEGGEIRVYRDDADSTGNVRCFIDDLEAPITSISNSLCVVRVPSELDKVKCKLYLTDETSSTEVTEILVGRRVAGGLHMVGNPAVDPKDNSVLLTISGGRGQKMPVSLLRLHTTGFLEELDIELTNPTGLAFNSAGELFVSNRSDGEVVKIVNDKIEDRFVSSLGIATGIAFDAEGTLYVGDRTGTVFRVDSQGDASAFAMSDPSVSAYHIAFGTDGDLYLSAPSLASNSVIQRIKPSGKTEVFAGGFGRPQGIAFDTEGNLYVAGSWRGARGVCRVSPDGTKTESLVAGVGIVGLCFSRTGSLLIATGNALYDLPLSKYGILLK